MSVFIYQPDASAFFFNQQGFSSYEEGDYLVKKRSLQFAFNDWFLNSKDFKGHEKGDFLVKQRRFEVFCVFKLRPFVSYQKENGKGFSSLFPVKLCLFSALLTMRLKMTGRLVSVF